MNHDDVSFDPMNALQASQDLMMQSYRFWELFARRYTEGLLRNQQFLDMTGKAFEQSLQFNRQFNQAVEALMAQMQLPTKEDIDRALHKMNELEGLLYDLHEKVDRLLAQQQ